MRLVREAFKFWELFACPHVRFCDLCGVPPPLPPWSGSGRAKVCFVCLLVCSFVVVVFLSLYLFVIMILSLLVWFVSLFCVGGWGAGGMFPFYATSNTPASEYCNFAIIDNVDASTRLHV